MMGLEDSSGITATNLHRNNRDGSRDEECTRRKGKRKAFQIPKTHSRLIIEGVSSRIVGADTREA